MDRENKIRKAFFFGDSNTFGYDPAGFMGGRYPREQRWTTILQNNLADTWQIDMLGTNDLLGTLRPSAAKTAGMMNELLTFVKAAAGSQGKNLQILLIAPPAIKLVDQSYEEPYVSGDRSYTDIYQEEGKKLSQYYRELAKYRKVLFADASEWPLSFAFDGVHLSEEGHAVFAQYMTEFLRQLPDSDHE